MASHSSAVKAHRQNLKRRARNRHLRSRLRGALRDIRTTLDAAASGSTVELTKTFSLIDRMVSKGIIHRNTAGRYKSRLAKQAAARQSASA